MNNIPKEGEIWAYGKVEYEIGCIRRKGEINIRKHKKEHDWIGYDITHFTSNLWKKISNSPNNIIPEKWCIKMNNQDVIDYCNKYGKIPPYQISNTLYAHFPDINGATSTDDIHKNYTEISLEFFREHILKKNNINKLKEFPSEGCCESIDINFERYFRNKYGAPSYSTSGIIKGISWNSGGWWFVSNVKSCIRKKYEIEELEHFFKKENKEELINKLTTNKKEENYEHTSKNKSIKVCRPDFKVSEGLRKRGIGIKSTGVKILIGNRHCNN